jgi:hypothetical protein
MITVVQQELGLNVQHLVVTSKEVLQVRIGFVSINFYAYDD